MIALALALTLGSATMKTCDHDAGAICSLTWNGKEFLNDYDHGRQLQSAVSFDGHGELQNPTEAGASYLTNGYNPAPSSSILLAADVTDGVLSTLSRPAYWMPFNGRAVSDILFTKRVQIGRILPGVIEYEVSYTIPTTEVHQNATFEALTAYLPPEFSRFWTVNPATKAIAPLSDGPGEQPLPVVISTADKQYALGIYATTGSYGRWRHPDTTKWNNVYRVTNPRGTYRFKSYVFVGTLWSVAANMCQLPRFGIPPAKDFK